MNSQYPNAMLNKLPTGNPVFSTNKNLEDYFGFVYAKLTPPSKDILKNLYIQHKQDNGRILCPRYVFHRWIATSELEMAIRDGYKAEILCGINFPEAKNVDSENLFKSFVLHFYDHT